MAGRSRSPLPSGVSGGNYDLVACMRRYIDRMIAERGLKILLIDEDTSGILSCVFSFNEILQKDLYLIQKLKDSQRTRQGHLKALVFVRPTQENIELLRQELQSPLYGEYHLFFSNVLEPRYLEQLAARDTHEVVKKVEELYSDYYSIHPHLFSCDMPANLLSAAAWGPVLTNRVADSVIAALLALRKRPLLRFQGNSEIARRVADRVSERMREESELFASERREESVLLFVDRKDDPVTPLLTQWTYEAMIHNEFGIRKHVVTIPPGQGNEEEESFNLIPLYDPFYSKNIFSNWGDLADNVEQLKRGYREKSQSTQAAKQKDGKPMSMDDIKKIMSAVPELRKDGILVSKHVGLALQLQKGIKSRSLMEVSELEQEMACNSACREHTEQLRDLLNNPQLRAEEALRLVMIYALRYERKQEAVAAVEEFTGVLRRKEGLGDVHVRLVDRVVQWAGQQQRASDLFEEGGGGDPGQRRGLMAKAREQAKQAARQAKQALAGGGGVEVENIYTQHEPLVKRTVEALYQGKLSEQLFPYAPRGQQAGSPGFRAKEVIVFFCGGATCEESRALHELLDEKVDGREEKRFPGCKVLLGCTDVLRTETFLEHLAEA